MIPATGQLAVPPGFRFHPTDEELLYYYLRKKVAYEAIDLDVIREVDLNKLEPWDLKDKCRIGTGPQNEWYFFSHKDKKYPTGTRTNRATTAGFWKATGRDKAIHVGSCSRRIGMRKTLVFYTGRAPHGQKTDWIMHEYRLDDDCSDVQEDGWVVCRVFKKKNHHQRGLGIPPDSIPQEEEVHFPHNHNNNYNNFTIPPSDTYSSSNFDTNSLHLPQLLSTEPSPHPTFIAPSLSLNSLDLECSHNLMKLTSGISASGNGVTVLNGGGGGGDWSILDKLLASHQNLDQLFTNNNNTNINKCNGNPTTSQFPFQYLGCDAHELLKFSKLG